MKKRILHITGGMDIGGLETVVMNLVRYADRSQFQIDILVYDCKVGTYEAEAISLGCRIFHLNNPRNHIKQYAEIKRIIKEHGPYDIVHSHTFFNSGIAMIAAFLCHTPIRIAHAHSIKRAEDDHFSKKVFYSVMRFVMGFCCTKYVACSKQAGSYVFGNKKFSSKGVVLPNFIDVDNYRYDYENRKRIREELSIDSNSVVLGCVGHLAPAKNQSFLIKLFAKMHLDNPSAVLVIVGDGILKQDLIQMATQNGVINSIRLTGTRTDIGRILSAFDVFVLPSIHEGFGIVAIEAMANGLRCVCEKNAIVSEIRKLTNCDSVEGFDSSEWIKCIETAYKKRGIVCPTDIRAYDIDHYSRYIKLIYSN